MRVATMFFICHLDTFGAIALPGVKLTCIVWDGMYRLYAMFIMAILPYMIV